MSRSVLVGMALVVALGGAINGAHAQPAVHGSPEKFVLSGVIVLEGGRGLAWLQEPTLTGNRVLSVRAGDSIGPYRVGKILDDRVELEGPAGTVLVPLSGPGGTAPAAVASTAAPGVPTPVSTPTPAPAPVSTPIPPPAQTQRSWSGPHRPTSPASAESPAEGRTASGTRPERSVEKPAEATKAAGAASQPEVSSGTNPIQNNPNVLFIPRGDPRRRQGFQSLRGGN